jgi:hypothetical protein
MDGDAVGNPFEAIAGSSSQADQLIGDGHRQRREKRKGLLPTGSFTLGE